MPDIFDNLKDKVKDVKVNYQGLDIKIRKDPDASQLLVSVTATGGLDFPGDSVENMIAMAFNAFQSGNFKSSSPASSSLKP